MSTASSARIPLPREHGAWGLLLQPFVAAAVLARSWDWLLAPALLLALLGFVIREPLTILARQRWTRHARSPLAGNVTRWLIAEAFAILVCFALLARTLPWLPLVLLAAVGLVLTVVSVSFTVRNRQRSEALQIAAAAGLGSSAFLAALAVTGGLPAWSFALWGLLTLHGVVSIPLVHARLQLRIPPERRAPGDPRRAIRYSIAAALVAAALTVMLAGLPYTLPILLSVAIVSSELWRLSRPGELRQPLPRVGLRLLAASFIHSAATVAVLW